MKVFRRKKFELVDLPREEEKAFLEANFIDAHRHIPVTKRLWEPMNKLFQGNMQTVGGEFGLRYSPGKNVLELFHSQKKGITTVLEVSKDILYDRQVRSWWSNQIDCTYAAKPGCICFREWGDYIIPIVAKLNFISTSTDLGKKMEVSEEKVTECFESWKYLQNECSFIYSGAPRGLYATREKKRIMAGSAQSIRKGDVVMIVDVDLYPGYTKRSTPSPYGLDIIGIDFRTWKFVHFDTFMRESGVWNWKTNVGIDSGLWMPHGALRLRSNGDLETTCVSGWIHVLVAGQHGWMKITNKPLIQFEQDFIADGTPEYQELFQWRSEQDQPK